MDIKHIGIIMDGNRRFSKRLMLQPWKGHEFGAKKIRDVLNWCKEKNIKMLTLYAFSHENFNRPKKEFNELMKLFSKELDDLLTSDEVNKNNLKINFIGRTQMFPKELQEKMNKLIEASKNNKKFTVNFAMPYSGRLEIVDAVKKILQSGISEDEFDEKILQENLYLNSDPELIIRTGGCKRLSNFLTFQSVYSELFFVDKMWPEFSKKDFDSIIEEFNTRKRSFGK